MTAEEFYPEYEKPPYVDYYYFCQNATQDEFSEFAEAYAASQVEKVKTRPAWRIVGELEAKIEELEYEILELHEQEDIRGCGEEE
jgi:hypothetical protein